MSLRRLSSDTVCSIGLLVFTGLLWFWLIPSFIRAGDEQALPRAITLIIGVLGLLLLLVSLSKSGQGQIAADEEDPFLERDTHGEPWRLFLLMGVWGADVLLMRALGFYPMSLVALVASFVILGMRDWWQITIWSVAPLVTVYLLFEHGFSLFLPRGRLITALLG